MNSPLLSKAFISALAMTTYAFLISRIMSNGEKWFGHDDVFGPVVFLLLLILSVCITGALILLRPVLLYLEGKKQDAIQLFAYTVGFLATFAIIIGLVLTMRSVGGRACTLEAKLCPDGSAVGRTGPKCEFAKCPGE